MKKLCVFASGNGSNFEAIAKEIPVSLLVCNKPNAKVIDRAEKLGIETYIVDTKKPKEIFETEIISKLNEYDIDFIALAGYMRLIGPTLLNAFENKIINIHPTLLPSFVGKDGIKRAFDYGVKITGVTVHYVDSGMDTGKIIAQVAILIEQDDTLETLSEKIHKEEHKLYVKVLKEML
ncbi:MAG: phosphoribosylglycinamide formyltransferase [Defluviitaleaceae bacterium]|nr:phosphoribosylglycinamide formyltransferase [Defluviitaleaceae bacterium]